ncbi:MAG: protein-L-isoaspartate(D-aspartate) O-methyltransferase [archaeon]
MMLIEKRVRMVRELQLEGIRDKNVLEAMRKIPRHEFVPEGMINEAYLNIPLPVGYEQTISQPYTISFMLEALELKKGQKVLEIGTASGYNASLISEIIGKKGKVYTLEIIPALAKFAEENIKKQGIKNVKVIERDGSLGYKNAAPYDRIIITAGAPEIPPPLTKQLKNGGMIIAPIGPLYSQNMIKATKTREGMKRKDLGAFVFVPLKGKYGHG